MRRDDIISCEECLLHDILIGCLGEKYYTPCLP